MITLFDANFSYNISSLLMLQVLLKTLVYIFFLLIFSFFSQGDISPEPNVVLQSVVLGKKPDTENECGEDCHAYTACNNDLNMIMKRIIRGLYPQPQPTRYKRDDSSYPGVEGFDDKTIERLLEALEELKEDTEKNPEEDVKEKDEGRKGRLDQIYRRGGKWQRKIEECQAKRRKGDVESCKKMLKDNLEDFLAENKDLEKRMKKMAYRKKDWKDEMERRRLKESLSESWPKSSEDRLGDDMYYPMPYHHQPSHHRGYPSGGYLP